MDNSVILTASSVAPSTEAHTYSVDQAKINSWSLNLTEQLLVGAWMPEQNLQTEWIQVSLFLAGIIFFKFKKVQRLYIDGWIENEIAAYFKVCK